MSHDENAFLTLGEAATTMRMTEDYARRQCHSGALVATKLGNRWRIRTTDLDAFMSGGSAPAARERDKNLTARQQKRAS